MDPVDSGSSSAAATGTRPSLFGNDPSVAKAAKPNEAISILSTLDKGGGKKPFKSSTGLPSWFAIAFGTLLGIAVSIAIVFGLTRDTGLHPPAAEPTIIAHADAPQQIAAPIPAAPTTEISAGAMIENAPPAAIEPDAVDAASPQPPAAETVTPAQVETTMAKDAAEPAPTQVAEPAPPVADKPAPTLAEKTVPPVPAEAKPHKAAGKTRIARRHAKSTKTPAPTDRDASLIAALVAYSEGKPAKDINADATAQAPPPAKAKTPTAAPTPAQSGQFGTNKRDVVVRTPATSTTELVRRCQKLGFVEGVLCRNRVCANHWGKDPACPQDAAPELGRNTE
jgi:hypothetical protein